MSFIMETFPACDHLELRVSGADKARVSSLLSALHTQPAEGEEGLGIEEINSLVRRLLALRYEPYCTQEESVCVAMESPVMSMQHYGGLYQTGEQTLGFSFHIRHCKIREHSVLDDSGEETVYRFILDHIKVDPENKKNL